MQPHNSKSPQPPQGSKPPRNVARLVDEIASASDKHFFQLHRGRTHRVRPAWDFEIEHFAGRPMPPEVGFCWWIVIKQITPGMRVRVPFQISIEAPVIELPEADAARVWAQSEAVMRKR